MTSSHRGDKVSEAFRCRLSLKEVHVSWCLFVFIRGSTSLKRSVVFPRMIRTAGRGGLAPIHFSPSRAAVPYDGADRTVQKPGCFR